MAHRIRFFCFDDCPGRVPTCALLDEVIAVLQPGTIRVDGRDVMPGFQDPGDVRAPSSSQPLAEARC